LTGWGEIHQKKSWKRKNSLIVLSKEKGMRPDTSIRSKSIPWGKVQVTLRIRPLINDVFKPVTAGRKEGKMNRGKIYLQ